MEDVLRLNCVHEMYQSSILLQQINYTILEEKYNNLLGNNYITEEADQKKQSIFRKVIETIKRWIGKIITFITKTIPDWIKKQAEKIAKLFKRRKNTKVIDVSKLPKTHQAEVKKLANSANAATKSSRKVEEIKAELVNPEDSDSYLVNSLRQMNAEMQHQTNAAFDDLKNTEYNTAMNITNRHAYLQQVMKEYQEQKAISEKKMEQHEKEINELIKRLGKLDDDKEEKTMKKQDQIAEELDSILDDIKDAVNKKEDVVVVDTPTVRFKGYRGMYINDKDMFNIDNDFGFANSAFNRIYMVLEDIDDYKDVDDAESKVRIRNRAYRAVNHKIDHVSDLYKILDRIKSTVNSVTLEEVTKDKLPTTKYVEQQLNRIKNSEKNILKFKKSIDTASRKSQISNEEALLFTEYFNLAMPATNRYIREMTNTLNYLIKIIVSFCDNAVAVYE